MTRPHTSSFLRRIAVTLGPLEEWRDATRGQTLRFEADGTPNGLKATIQTQRTLMGMPPPSTITVYNLSRDTRNAIREGLTKVTVEAGYRDQPLHIVFQGSVLSAISERSGPEIATTISAISGYGGIIRGVTSRTFYKGMPLKTVLMTLAQDMPGIKVSEAALESITGHIMGGGWTFSGSTKDALNQLANEYGFSWHVENGRFRALGDKAEYGNTLTLNGKNGGLMSVTPKLSDPMQRRGGVSLKAVYVPGVTAGSRVKVNSEISPQLNGVYRVHTAAFNLDAYSDQWTMDIDAFTLT